MDALKCGWYGKWHLHRIWDGLVHHLQDRQKVMTMLALS